MTASKSRPAGKPGGQDDDGHVSLIVPAAAVTAPASLRVAEIIAHETAADAHAGISDAHRWEAARLIAEELDSGKSQRQLAAEIGKHHNHVRWMAQVWRGYLGIQSAERPRFNHAYQALKSKPEPAAIESPETQPQVTREKAGEVTQAIRKRVADVACKTVVGLMSGVEPTMILGELARTWRSARLNLSAQGFTSGEISVLASTCYTPLIEAVSLWPDGPLADDILSVDDELRRLYLERFSAPGPVR